MDKVICPYCRSPIEDSIASICSGCSSSYHKECFGEVKGCIITSCSSVGIKTDHESNSVILPKINTCSNCQRQLPSNSQFCTGCGSKIDDADTNQPIVRNVCQKCKKYLSPNSSFCTGCGAKVAQVQVEQQLKSTNAVSQQSDNQHNSIEITRSGSQDHRNEVNKTINSASNNAVGTSTSIADQLRSLAEMHKEGLLSEVEFINAKNKLLS
jgi:predicted amidophosphoribosyltransferase